MECIDGTQAHYWMIEPSKGSTSCGTCNRCNETRKFHNSIEAITAWKDQGDQAIKNRKNQLVNLGRRNT